MSFIMRRRNRGGYTFILAIVAMTTMCMIISLAVDLGRAQLAKTQLRAAADAAARYGARGFSNNSVNSNAKAAALQNLVDGTGLVLQNADIAEGYWNGTSFSTSSGTISAVRVTARRLQSRSTAVPLFFSAMMGRRGLDITVQSIATYTAPTTVAITAQAKANPWLAGMPNGTTANEYDSAPIDTPAQVTGIPITPGAKMNFSFSGGVSYLPGTGANGPDGDTDYVLYNWIYDGFSGGREHGKSNLTAPITAVVGIFLNDANPTTQGAPPTDLDFSSSTSRDFSTLSPQLRQPFFIGDGKRNDGSTVQDFVVPTGATRLYIGVMDGQQWSDNSGSFTTNVTLPSQIILVK